MAAVNTKKARVDESGRSMLASASFWFLASSPDGHAHGTHMKKLVVAFALVIFLLPGPLFAQTKASPPPPLSGKAPALRSLPSPGTVFKPVTVTTAPVALTGTRFTPVVITTSAVVLTGARFQSVTVTTNAVTLTGTRFQPVIVTTNTVAMTGVRFQPVSLTTSPVNLTGIRFQPITIATDAVALTGTRP